MNMSGCETLGFATKLVEGEGCYYGIFDLASAANRPGSGMMNIKLLSKWLEDRNGVRYSTSIKVGLISREMAKY
jgi:hypothetical protein